MITVQRREAVYKCRRNRVRFRIVLIILTLEQRQMANMNRMAVVGDCDKQGEV